MVVRKALWMLLLLLFIFVGWAEMGYQITLILSLQIKITGEKLHSLDKILKKQTVPHGSKPQWLLFE